MCVSAAVLHITQQARTPAPLSRMKDLLIAISRATRLEAEILEELSGSAIKMPTSLLCVTPARPMPCCGGRQRGEERLLGGRQETPPPPTLFISFFVCLASEGCLRLRGIAISNKPLQ